MQLVLTDEEKLALLTPEQAGKILKLGRDKMLGLFNDGSIKTMLVGKAVDHSSGKVREFRRTTRKWLEEWLEKEAMVKEEKVKIHTLRNKPVKTKFPVGMKTTDFFKQLDAMNN